ncbi:TlpA family protein disulfide reductase [Saccharicrinis carchari]|nr:TlpA disulfide reductase family protein [Saccharicrinis carchari]
MATEAAENKNDRGYIVKVGDMAPDFITTLDNGKTFKLSDHRGKVVMLQFTASWCGVCRKEMPFIEKEIWQMHKDKGLVLIGVDRDEPLEKLKALSEATGITYPLALDPGGDIFELYALKKSGITRNVIIDREGKIVYLTRLFKRQEFDDMKAKIERLLKE